jgi:simple sugar transport system substrate-binding protein
MGEIRRRISRGRALALVAGAMGVMAVAVLAGCGGSSSGAEATAATSDTGAASSDSGPKQSIIMLNGPLSDPYFGALKQGSDAAAEELGIEYQYSAPPNLANFVPEYTTLINQAIGRKPDAIVIGNFVPEAFDPLIEKATAAGIPVVVVNAGLESWEADGAVGYVGFLAEELGEVAAEASLKEGVTTLLCINHAPVNPELEARCKGAEKIMSQHGGKVEELPLPYAESGTPAAVTQGIQGFISSHPEVDGVLTLGSAITTDALTAIDNLGKEGEIKVGAVTLSTAELEDIKGGSMAFAVDEQPFLQGYYGMLIASQYAKYQMRPTAPVLVGGLLIDKGNVDATLAVQNEYPGIRGAE